MRSACSGAVLSRVISSPKTSNAAVAFLRRSVRSLCDIGRFRLQILQHSIREHAIVPLCRGTQEYHVATVAVPQNGTIDRLDILHGESSRPCGNRRTIGPRGESAHRVTEKPSVGAAVDQISCRILDRAGMRRVREPFSAFRDCSPNGRVAAGEASGTPRAEYLLMTREAQIGYSGVPPAHKTCRVRQFLPLEIGVDAVVYRSECIG